MAGPDQPSKPASKFGEPSNANFVPRSQSQGPPSSGPGTPYHQNQPHGSYSGPQHLQPMTPGGGGDYIPQGPRGYVPQGQPRGGNRYAPPGLQQQSPIGATTYFGPGYYPPGGQQTPVNRGYQGPAPGQWPGSNGAYFPPQGRGMQQPPFPQAPMMMPMPMPQQNQRRSGHGAIPKKQQPGAAHKPKSKPGTQSQGTASAEKKKVEQKEKEMAKGKGKGKGKAVTEPTATKLSDNKPATDRQAARERAGMMASVFDSVQATSGRTRAEQYEIDEEKARSFSSDDDDIFIPNIKD
ncbi:hypothetical protein GGR50DRAFT_693212 [Xylaria sp. CBS 124048]|nr:hypothetical protein GGR50DRAFT_693212 [Xylaria sp. CBS 124048]